MRPILTAGLAGACVLSAASAATMAASGRFANPARVDSPFGAVGQPAGPETVPGTTYNLTTTLASAANAATLIEASTPTPADDKVVFDGLEERINNYLVIAGSNLNGQQRFVTESVGVSTAPATLGLPTYTFTVRALNAAGTAPGDLWPDGLVAGTTPLTGGTFFLGVTLAAALGGADAVDVLPGQVVRANSMTVVTDGVPETFSLPASFFATTTVGGLPTWDGFTGVIFGNAATNDPATPGPDIDSSISLTVTLGPVPEPTTLAAVAGLGAFALRRRRA